MSERVYKLLNGSELLVSEEVIGVRLKPESMPLTTDGNGVIDDVLDLLDKTVDERDRLRKELEEARKEIEFHRNAAKIYRKATSDIHNTLRWGDSENALERVETIIELAQVQEGEGNHE